MAYMLISLYLFWTNRRDYQIKSIMQYYFWLWELRQVRVGAAVENTFPKLTWSYKPNNNEVSHHTNIPLILSILKDPEGECSGGRIKIKGATQKLRSYNKKHYNASLILGPLKYREEIKIWFLPSGRTQSSWAYGAHVKCRERIWRFLQMNNR